MEFGTGHDVQPGHDIALETSSGTQDLGQATYDSDHDGVGDSVMIIQDDHAYLITDTDHDGYADSVRAFDASGHEVDPTSGQAVGDPGGSTGDAGQGSNVQGGGADGYASSGGPVAGDVVLGTTAAVSGVGLTVAGDDGTGQDLGAATVDLDRDGTADTAVVREADGSVIGYTDRDGDGIADQMTRIGTGGDVVISVSDGRGGWEVAATGHLDDAGTLVEDPAAAVQSI
jgi:hypothetical protein